MSSDHYESVMRYKLPALTARQLLVVLKRHGFVPIRQSGSHIILKHQDGRHTTVPLHKGRDVGKGLLRQILRDAKLTIDDLLEG